MKITEKLISIGRIIIVRPCKSDTNKIAGQGREIVLNLYFPVLFRKN